MQYWDSIMESIKSLPPKYSGYDHHQLQYNPNANDYAGSECGQSIAGSSIDPGHQNPHANPNYNPNYNPTPNSNPSFSPPTPRQMHGVKQVTITKEKGKLGLRVREMSWGVFVCLVVDASPAMRSGLRFGDQILQVDGQDMAGLSLRQVHTIFQQKSPGQSFIVTIRDRPFERAVGLDRDGMGNLGFDVKNSGKIWRIVKYSSAAQNGLLLNHQIIEINGENVIGLDEKEIRKVIGRISVKHVNVTIMPEPLFRNIIEEMNPKLLTQMYRTYQDV